MVLVVVTVVIVLVVMNLVVVNGLSNMILLILQKVDANGVDLVTVMVMIKLKGW